MKKSQLLWLTLCTFIQSPGYREATMWAKTQGPANGVFWTFRAENNEFVSKDFFESLQYIVHSTLLHWVLSRAGPAVLGKTPKHGIASDPWGEVTSCCVAGWISRGRCGNQILHVSFRKGNSLLLLH